MRASDSRRVLFVHVPKTGGSTIDAMFDKEVPDARRVPGKARHTPLRGLLGAEPRLADYWTFGFVRNPWARMVSWWSMVGGVFARVDAGHPPALAKLERFPKAWLPEGAYRHDFEQFVLEGTQNLPKLARPQVRTLSPRRRVDFVGRVESFVADVAVVRQHLGLPSLDEIPRRNSSSHGDYRDYYNDKTRTRIAEVFADDIATFGYTFDGTQAPGVNGRGGRRRNRPSDPSARLGKRP